MLFCHLRAGGAPPAKRQSLVVSPVVNRPRFHASHDMMLSTFTPSLLPSVTPSPITPRLAYRHRPHLSPLSSPAVGRCIINTSLRASAACDDGFATELEPHFTSPSTLSWPRKMDLSYKLERGEDLMDVLIREDDVGIDTIRNSSNDDKHLQLATACATSQLPIASHDFLRSSEAIYIYGNLSFLKGFGYDWDEFVVLPSRKCVETEGEVEERQRLLDAVKENAVQSDTAHGAQKKDDDSTAKYDNLIRVRKDKRKILLKGVNLWNVYDIASDEEIHETRLAIEKGDVKAIGQAVWIKHVDFLD